MGMPIPRTMILATHLLQATNPLQATNNQRATNLLRATNLPRTCQSMQTQKIIPQVTRLKTLTRDTGTETVHTTTVRRTQNFSRSTSRNYHQCFLAQHCIKGINPTRECTPESEKLGN